MKRVIVNHKDKSKKSNYDNNQNIYTYIPRIYGNDETSSRDFGDS